MSYAGPSRAAADSTSASSTLTPTLMFGANTTGIVSACRASSAFCSAENPVVPTTAPAPCRAHAARWAMLPSGRVKSIMTSATPAAASASVPTVTPVARPNRSPASRPTALLPATSKAATSSLPASASTASISACPIRPPAPAMAIRAAIVSS